MRRSLFLALLALGLGPVWGFRFFPTQDGPSHMLNAWVFKQCADPSAPEAEFFERRLSPIPNWTASALLHGLTAVLPPFVAEKVVISLYVVGLPLAVDYFLAALGASGVSVLGLLFIWNSCLFRGFYSYCLGVALLFLVLGWFLRRKNAFGVRDTAWLCVLLLAAYLTHLASFLITLLCLLWLAATGPKERFVRIASILAASLPASVLTFYYFLSTGFFGTPEVSGAVDIAKEEVRGTAWGLWETPNVLYREIFAAHEGVWLVALAGLGIAAWLWDCEEEGTHGSRSPRWSVLTLAAILLLLFGLIPDTLRAHGGFLKARLAPVSLLLALGAVRSGPRGRIEWRHAAGLALVVANLAVVVRHVARMDREIEEFTTGIAWVGAGETLIFIKAPVESTAVVDTFSSEYYCLTTHAICLSSYEGGTEHFPVRFRRGVKHRIRLNRPGSFWADVVLAWGAPEDMLPLADEPYVEAFRRGKLRLFRRLKR